MIWSLLLAGLVRSVLWAGVGYFCWRSRKAYGLAGAALITVTSLVASFDRAGAHVPTAVISATVWISGVTAALFLVEAARNPDRRAQ